MATRSKRKRSGSTRTSKKRSTSSRKSSRGSAELSELEDGFLAELADMLHAEKQLLKALPKMAKAIQSPELRTLIEEHLEQTREQVSRLEQVFETIDEDVKTEKCEGMQGIIEEGNELVKKTEEGATRDALVIGAQQKVEHYEIASYGTLCTWAEELGYDDAVQLLEQNLYEEKAADKKLSRLAESRLNRESSGRNGSRDGRSQMGFGRSTRRDSDEREQGYESRRRAVGSGRGQWREDGEELRASRSGRESGGYEQGYDDRERSYYR